MADAEEQDGKSNLPVSPSDSAAVRRPNIPRSPTVEDNQVRLSIDSDGPRSSRDSPGGASVSLPASPALGRRASQGGASPAISRSRPPQTGIAPARSRVSSAASAVPFHPGMIGAAPSDAGNTLSRRASFASSLTSEASPSVRQGGESVTGSGPLRGIQRSSGNARLSVDGPGSTRPPLLPRADSATLTQPWGGSQHSHAPTLQTLHGTGRSVDGPESHALGPGDIGMPHGLDDETSMDSEELKRYEESVYNMDPPELDDPDKYDGIDEAATHNNLNPGSDRPAPIVVVPSMLVSTPPSNVFPMNIFGGDSGSGVRGDGGGSGMAQGESTDQLSAVDPGLDVGMRVRPRDDDHDALVVDDDLDRSTTSRNTRAGDDEEEHRLSYLVPHIKSTALSLLIIGLFCMPGFVLYTAYPDARPFGVSTVSWNSVSFAVLALTAAYIVASIATRVVLIFVEHFKLVDVYFIQFLSQPSVNFLTALTALVLYFVALSDGSDASAWFERVLIMVTILTASLLIKVAGMRYLSISYHKSVYFDRMQAVVEADAFVFRLLKGPKLQKRHRFDRIINRGVARRPNGEALDSTSVPSTEEPNVVRAETDPTATIYSYSKVAGLIRHVLRRKIMPMSTRLKGRDKQTRQLRAEARSQARLIFATAKKSPTDVLTRDDLRRYGWTPTEVAKALTLFNGEKTGYVTITNLTDSMQRLITERKGLSRTIRDTRTVVSKLENLVTLALLFGLVFVALLIFRVDVDKTLVYVAIILTFVNGGQLGNLYTAVVFVLVQRPYDVGDRIVIDGLADHMVVMRINLMSTETRSWRGHIIIWPNVKLASMVITNHRRSTFYEIEHQIRIPLDTDKEKLNDLDILLREFVQDRRDDWDETSLMTIMTDIDMKNNSANYWVWIDMRDGWQNIARRWRRQDDFMRYMFRVMQELGIEWQPPSQPVDISSSSPLALADLGQAEPGRSRTIDEDHQSMTESHTAGGDATMNSRASATSRISRRSAASRRFKTFSNRLPVE